MNSLVRLLINFVLSGLLVLAFRGINWIQFEKPPVLSSNAFLNDLFVAGVIALVIFIVGEVIGIIYKFVKTIFFFLGCVIAIIYFFISGYLKLWIASLILANWFNYTYELLPVLIISFLIGFVRLPQKNEMDEELREYRKWKKQNRK